MVMRGLRKQATINKAICDSLMSSHGSVAREPSPSLRPHRPTVCSFLLGRVHARHARWPGLGVCDDVLQLHPVLCPLVAAHNFGDFSAGPTLGRPGLRVRCRGIIVPGRRPMLFPQDAMKSTLAPTHNWTRRLFFFLGGGGLLTLCSRKFHRVSPSDDNPIPSRNRRVAPSSPHLKKDRERRRTSAPPLRSPRQSQPLSSPFLS